MPEKPIIIAQTLIGVQLLLCSTTSTRIGGFAKREIVMAEDVASTYDKIIVGEGAKYVKYLHQSMDLDLCRGGEEGYIISPYHPL